MAYTSTPAPGPVLPPVRFVQSSAKYWRDLQKYNASRGMDGGSPRSVAVRMGNQVMLLPVFSRAKMLGQDESDLESVSLSDIFPGEALSPGPAEYSLGETENLPTLASSGFAPIVPTSALESSPLSTLEPTVNPDVTMSVGGGILDLTPSTSATASTSAALDLANQQLTNAQASGNQSAINAALSAVATATKAVSGSTLTTKGVPAATSGQIITGIPNTTLLLGGAIVLIVLAGTGKKR